MDKLVIIVVMALLGGLQQGEAQIIKKLKKRAERAAERTVERRVERETSKKTDEVLDSILEPGKKGNDPGYPDANSLPPAGNTGNTNSEPHASESVDGNPGRISVYSKFDFVPGDKLLFFDDFSGDYLGDFPSKWNTNGSGEVVSLNGKADTWFEMKSGHSNYFIPDMPPLPEEYTIEFDLHALGLDNRTASTTVFKIIISDDSGFKLGNYALAQLSFCQYAPVSMRVVNSTRDINNEISADIREAIRNNPHISVAVNGQRFRLWVNETKYMDIPRLLPDDPRPDGLKFELLYFKDGKERLLLKNLKVAKGGSDLRKTLIAEGKVSTNGILFHSGSASIQPQSMGIIRQISQALQQEGNINLTIIGYTDSDGEEVANLRLSQQRAAAVKETLVNIYDIDPGRISTEGKGETEPVEDNSTSDGKAQNRRVEFIVI